MASLDHIATVFSEYKYDKDVGFKKVEGVPCLACVSNLDRDVSCKCVWGNEPESCVLCDHYEKQCGSMPPQLLGGEDDPLVDPTLTERQFWRIHVALEACGAAWRELEGHLMDPNNSTTIFLQELASTREIMTASALQSAGANFSHDELRDRIVASQSAYTRDDNCVVTLRDALARLSVAENTVVQSVPEEEGDCLPYDFPSELRSALWSWRNHSTPTPVVVHNGMPTSDSLGRDRNSHYGF
ncbi:uncharacterized protein FPRO_11234 [Fusarium proliferatum ET1]|uniref:Uncharacterized protein n=1 Tax=Fusarium proliferatum (strain ET1) TaxID=1227346 RepID=A0A1L7VPQ2_FUSPR|nr:uncharacterized protein FPRO_11234 [Fusarium proliferatum ET1]CZR41645.1 uncharacterized protein FPRO_11234 [Fusarium proliferatum ET1]